MSFYVDTVIHPSIINVPDAPHRFTTQAYLHCDPKAQHLVKTLIQDPYNYDQRPEGVSIPT